MTARVALTYRDYAALPDEGKRYEIHDGELWEMAAPTTLHQILLVRLLAWLDANCASAQCFGVCQSIESLCAPLRPSSGHDPDCGEVKTRSEPRGGELGERAAPTPSL